MRYGGLTPSEVKPGRIDVCFRPESLQIHPATLPHRSPDWIEISGHIVEVVSFGPERHYVVDTQEGRYLAIEHVRGHVRASKGEPVVLTFRPEDCILLPGGDPSG